MIIAQEIKDKWMAIIDERREAIGISIIESRPSKLLTDEELVQLAKEVNEFYPNSEITPDMVDVSWQEVTKAFEESETIRILEHVPASSRQWCNCGDCT